MKPASFLLDMLTSLVAGYGAVAFVVWDKISMLKLKSVEAKQLKDGQKK
jgi:hypothetical protein